MDRQQGRFTGWHATFILVAFFGVVVAVNLTMASYARSSFGGVVVENSYVASQHFNGWLERARESERLGWRAEVSRLPDGRLSVALAGAPEGASLKGVARHPLGRLDDVALSFARQADGRYLSNGQLPDGRWTLRLEAQSGNDIWRSEEELR